MVRICHFRKFSNFYANLDHNKIRTRTNFKNSNSKSSDLHLYARRIISRLNRFYRGPFSKYPKYQNIFRLCYKSFELKGEPVESSANGLWNKCQSSTLNTLKVRGRGVTGLLKQIYEIHRFATHFTSISCSKSYPHKWRISTTTTDGQCFEMDDN